MPLATGFEATLQLLSTIQSQDEPPGLRTRSRDGHQLPASIVLTGSRALQATLSRFKSIDPSTLPIPAPLFPADIITNTSDGEEPPTANKHHYEFIITPAALADLIQQWHTSSRLRFVYAINELKVQAGVSVGAASNEIYLCDFELLRPKTAWKCSAEALKRSSDCSSLLIAKSAAESGITEHCSCLGITQPVPIPSLAVQFAIKRSHIFYPFSWRKHIQQLHFLLHHFPRLLKWNVADITTDLLAYKVYLARQEEFVGQWIRKKQTIIDEQPSIKKQKLIKEEDSTRKDVEVIKTFYKGVDCLSRRAIYLVSQLLKNTIHVTDAKDDGDEWILKVNARDKGVRLYFDLFDQDDVSDSESCDSDSDYDYVLVQINGETILYINLETFEERVYFRGRYLSPSETFITWIDILEPVDHFISEVFNEDSALIPPCLFVAAVFHIIGKEHTKDSEKLKKVLEKFTEGPSLGPIPENNLGAIWQCAHPITALLEYAKYSNDFSFIADWSDLSEEVIDKLADEISRSKFHKFVLSPETFECDKILRAVASNWRITTVCFEGYCPEYGDEFYGEQFPVLDSLVGQETGYADIDELIEKVFDIWSETETLHQRTIRYDSLHAIKPINIPINCVIPSCILSVNSSEPLDSHPYPLTIEIGKGREMVASNTRYLKRLGMLRNAYYFITGKRLEDDFPITLPVQDSLKLCHLFLINSSHEPIQDCCLDLIPWDVWLLIIEELDPKDFEKLALSNTSLGALVTALVLHWFIKEPNYPYDRSVRAVLEKWRYVIQKHKQKFGSFAYHKYTEEFGVKLHVDLRSVGYDCGYQDVEKKYRAFLYNNTQL